MEYYGREEKDFIQDVMRFKYCYSVREIRRDQLLVWVPMRFFFLPKTLYSVRDSK